MGRGRPEGNLRPRHRYSQHFRCSAPARLIGSRIPAKLTPIRRSCLDVFSAFEAGPSGGGFAVSFRDFCLGGILKDAFRAVGKRIGTVSLLMELECVTVAAEVT